jgi:RND family efflux transporter MFP subunit
MKQLLPLFILAIILATGCAPAPQAGEAIPQDLEGKRAYLKTKKTELQELTRLIATLESQIDSLDPNRRVDKGQLVTTIPVGRKDFRHYVEIQGSVQADNLVDVTSEAAGRIVRLLVKEGDPVRAGQLVAELDLEQINKQIAELEKSLELATTVYERQSRLWEQNIGSEIQYLEAKNNKERLEKSLETLNFQLDKAKVYAPASGVVEREMLQGGEMAMPGAPIVQILNTNRLKVVVDVPENYLRAVRPGETVEVSFPALDRQQTAQVSLIGRTIDPANRTFKVEANISGVNGLLKPNLLATMLINDFEEKDVVTVPLETVQQEVSGQKFVYVVGEGPEGKVAQKVYVKTGRSYEGEIVINEGLQGGEELILEGARGLVENAMIQIQEPQTTASNG